MAASGEKPMAIDKLLRGRGRVQPSGQGGVLAGGDAAVGHIEDFRREPDRAEPAINVGETETLLPGGGGPECGRALCSQSQGKQAASTAGAPVSGARSEWLGRPAARATGAAWPFR